MDTLGLSNWVEKKRQSLPKRIRIRNRLAKASLKRREQSLLSLVDLTTTFVVSGISEDITTAYKDPETRRRERETHAERMHLLNVQLPRLMARIDANRSLRIMVEVRHIARVVFNYLKIQMKRTRGIRLLMNRANHARLLHLMPCWVKGHKTRKLIIMIDKILYRPLLAIVFGAWASFLRKSRLKKRYVYAYIRKNTIVFQKRTIMRCWKQHTANLSKLRGILRSIALSSTKVRPCLNSWSLYTKTMKTMKKRLRRKMMGLKQAALIAWHEITANLVERRIQIYTKFSRRFRHRNLLLPFNTLHSHRQKSLSAKLIQSFVRGSNARRYFEHKKDQMLKQEMTRGKRERLAIATSVEKQQKEPIKSLLLKQSMKILSDHIVSKNNGMHSKNLPVPCSPRSRMLRPLFVKYDIDDLGTIPSSHIARFSKDLGLDKTMGNHIKKRISSRTLSEKRMKTMLDKTKFEQKFVVKLRRTIRSKITNWSIMAATRAHIFDIRAENSRAEAQRMFRQANESPHLSCSGCGEGFVLWRSLVLHQNNCILHHRKTSSNNLSTTRTLLSKIIKKGSSGLSL